MKPMRRFSTVFLGMIMALIAACPCAASDLVVTSPKTPVGGATDPSLFSILNQAGNGTPQLRSKEPDSLLDPGQRIAGIMSQALGQDDLETLARFLGPQGRAEGFAADLDLGQGLTPLMQVQSPEAAKMLLTAGAHPDAADSQGFTALHHAVTHDRAVEIVPILLAGGSDVQARNADGQTMLNLLKVVFIEFRDYEQGRKLLGMLVRAGADIDARDNQGYGLLHDAAGNDNAPLARAVLALGARRDLPNADGDTPLAIARKRGSHEVEALLEK
jgi:ankyrin repeat protein